METKIQKLQVARLRIDLVHLFPGKCNSEYFRLPISQGLFAIVDNKNKEKLLSAGMWCAQVLSGGVYACTNITGKKISLQDFLSGKLHTGFKNKLILDC